MVAKYEGSFYDGASTVIAQTMLPKLGLVQFHFKVSRRWCWAWVGVAQAWTEIIRLPSFRRCRPAKRGNDAYLEVALARFAETIAEAMQRLIQKRMPVLCKHSRFRSITCDGEQHICALTVLSFSHTSWSRQTLESLLHVQRQYCLPGRQRSGSCHACRNYWQLSPDDSHGVIEQTAREHRSVSRIQR